MKHQNIEMSDVVSLSVPLCLFIKCPQFQVKLQLSSFLISFFYCCHPAARGIKSCLDHLKLLQARLMDVLLLHYIQLWETQQMTNLRIMLLNQ